MFNKEKIKAKIDSLRVERDRQLAIARECKGNGNPYFMCAVRLGKEADKLIDLLEILD